MTDEQKRQFVIAVLEQRIAKKKSEFEGLRRYQASMRSGALWFLKAWELKYSSDVLHRSELRNHKKTFSFLSQELLLLGFAFEVLFKAFYISKHKSFSKKMKSHTLHDLAKLSNIHLAYSGLELLNRLSKVVWWQGRYPCALKPAESNPDNFSDSDVRSLRKLWKECCGQTPDSIGDEIYRIIKSTKKRESKT